MNMRTLPILLLLFSLTPLHAEEWPGWRGPRGDGTSTETNLPVRWGASDNVAWKSDVPGTGHSSPVVWGDRIFVTSCVEDRQERLLLCYDRRDGRRPGRRSS
jgi:outer membrane protein assembly factor BamB